MIYDVLIIGSGPAGMTAAIYAKRANLNVMMFEKGAPGGQIVNTFEVENYPGFKKLSGYELATNMFEHVLELGVPVTFEEVKNVIDLGNIKEVHTENGIYQTKTVLIATGVVPRTLGVPNEDRFQANGISWCAICDGPLYKDKNVIVVGGGNSAVEESLFLTNIATHITVVQNLDHLTADPKAVELLKQAKNVDIIYNAEVKEFLGDTQLEGARIQTQNGLKDIQADGVFEYIGLVPITTFVKGLNITNPMGYVEVSDTFETKVPGIFSAGDCNVKKIRQIVTAVSDGAIATQNIIKYLENQH